MEQLLYPPARNQTCRSSAFIAGMRYQRDVTASETCSLQIRGVLFDLDNTLHDRDEAFIAWAHDFVVRNLKVDDPAKIRETITLIQSLDRGGAGDKIELFEALKLRFPTLLETPQELLADFFATRTDYMRLSDHAQVLFATLAERRIPWGIVTNGGREQWDKLRAMQLDLATTCILVSHDFGIRKPEADIFRAASTKLGRAPEEILFVGDDEVNDIVGAKSAGMTTAWVRRGRCWPKALKKSAPDMIIGDIEELITLFI
jgi:putative hydrolase of the HAD superfamily